MPGGELVNMINVDCQKFIEASVFVNMMWSSPLQVGISIYLLYQTIGVSVFVGMKGSRSIFCPKVPGPMQSKIMLILPNPIKNLIHLQTQMIVNIISIISVKLLYILYILQNISKFIQNIFLSSFETPIKRLKCN